MSGNLEDIYDDDGFFEGDEFNNEDNLGDEGQNDKQVSLFDDDKDDFFSSNSNQGGEENTIIDDLLQSKGIKDSKVTVIGEDGTEEVVSFFELSKEDQLAILLDIEPTKASPEPIPEDLKEFVENLNKGNISIKEYLAKYKQEVLEEASNSTVVYEIDSYDDEELFLLDLKNKFDLTDEELVKELETAKQDEGLFKKKVDKLRVDYKSLEEKDRAQKQLDAEQTAQDEYNEFISTMVDTAVKTPEFYGIELEEDDHNEVLSYLLELDESGASRFYKDLDNPQKLYEAAWFMRYGKAAFDAIKDAYETEISKLKKEKDKPTVVVNRDKTNRGNPQIKSIHDLT